MSATGCIQQTISFRAHLASPCTYGTVHGRVQQCAPALNYSSLARGESATSLSLPSSFSLALLLSLSFSLFGRLHGLHDFPLFFPLLAHRGGNSCIPRLPVLPRLFFFLFFSVSSSLGACRPPLDEEATDEKITSALTLRNPPRVASSPREVSRYYTFYSRSVCDGNATHCPVRNKIDQCIKK